MAELSWPPKSREELAAAVRARGYYGAARMYGVNRNTLRAVARRWGIRSPHPSGTPAAMRHPVGAAGTANMAGPSHSNAPDADLGPAYAGATPATGPVPDPVQAEAARQAEALRRSAERRALREAGSLERVLETLREVVTPLNRREISLVQVPVGGGDEEEAVALVSDQQIGQVVDPEELYGLGAFSSEVFGVRVERWTKAIMKILRLHQRAYPVRRLHVWFLGDNTEGVLVYRGQAWHVDRDKLEQLFLGTQAFARALVSLLQVVERLEITGLPGNHGREGRKGEARLLDNSDLLFYYILALLLTNYRDRIEWHIPRSWFAIREVMGWRFLLLHGDEINASQTYGIPYYGLWRADAGYAKLLAGRELHYHYMVIGHHHQAAMIDSPTGEQITNGSWVGANELSVRSKRLAVEPSQWLFGVHPRKGITWRYKIRLYEPGDEELVPKRAAWPVFGEAVA